MGTAGIKKALIKDAKQNVKPYNNSFLVELGHGHSSFTAYVDKSCLGPGTGNPETTIQGVKWFVVRQHVWSSYKRAYPELSPSEFFTKLNTEEKGLKTFDGNNLVVDANTFNDGSVGDIGVIYLIIPYSVFPETDQTVPLQAVLLDKPQVLYCNFKFPKGGYIPLENNEKKATYGQTVEVEVYTHLLPDYRNGSDKFVFDVELMHKGEAVAKLEKQEILNRELGAFDYNPTKTLKFTIDSKWQENHADEKIDEKYYLRLKGVIGYSRPVLVASDYVASSGEYDSEKQTSSWKRLENGKWVYDTSNELLVPFDKMSDLLNKFEVEKNNQIQYIGDIRYTQKGFDPCGYSTITITDESDKDRKPFVIFDEEDAKIPIDRTAQIFGIIAGEERKDISITLGKLTNKKVLCNGLLLEAGQKHDDIKRVFQIDRVMPALRNKDGVYVVEEDPEQEGDVDVVPDKKKGLSRDVSEVQQWQEGVDFKFEGENKMILMLKYGYNKTYESTFAKLLGYTVDTVYSTSQIEIQSMAWLARYIFMKEGYKQIFFVPISTCRYPNQIAKVEVHPDFEWWINFKYKSDNPVFVKQNPNYKYRIFTTEDNQNQKLAGERRTEENKNWKLKKKEYKLEFEATYKVNGKEHKLIPGDGFPVLNAIRFLLKAYEIVNAITFADESADSEGSIANGTARTSEGGTPERRMSQRWQQRKAKGFPFRIELGMPSFSGGINGKFAQSKKHVESVGSFYHLEVAAKPLFSFKGELDLLFYAQFIGPIGQAMYRISQIVKKVNYLTLGAVHIDYYIYVGLKAELNIELKAVEYHSIDGWNGGEVQIYIPASLYVRAGVDVNVSIQGIGKGKAGAKIHGEAKFESRITYDKRANKAPAFIKFDGLDAKITITLEAKSDNSEDSESEEPDYITSLLEPKNPWEIEIL